MCEKMDYNNRIELNPKLRKDYIDHFNKLTSSKKAPSGRTLQRYETALKELNLIINPKKSGALVYVNPKYAFKGKLSARPTLMNRLADMAFKGEIDLSTIIDQPVESIQPK
jgi:hypothetical protein